jgi:hypothetical protein
MAQMASFFAPRGVASVWPFMIPVLAVPSVAGAFGGGDGNRLGGAAYGLVAGTVTGIVGYPLAAMASVRLRDSSDRSSPFMFGGIVPLVAMTVGMMGVPAYFAGKRAKGGDR